MGSKNPFTTFYWSNLNICKMRVSSVTLNKRPCVLRKDLKKKVLEVNKLKEKKQKRIFRKSHSNRTYALSVFTGYKRGKRNQQVNTSLLRVHGAFTKNDAAFYVGKKCAFVYKPAPKRSKKAPERNFRKLQAEYRVMWGKVTRTHGNSGMVRAKFNKNLPASAMAHRVRIMLYPSRI